MSAIAAIQMTSGPDVAANLEQARPLLEDAARRGAQLAVLPENFSFLGLRDTDKREVAEADGSGPVQDFLSATAKRLNIWIVAGTTPIKAGVSATGTSMGAQSRAGAATATNGAAGTGVGAAAGTTAA
jgi:predicted amidohydrolase